MALLTAVPYSKLCWPRCSHSLQALPLLCILCLQSALASLNSRHGQARNGDTYQQLTSHLPTAHQPLTSCLPATQQLPVLVLMPYRGESGYIRMARSSGNGEGTEDCGVTTDPVIAIVDPEYYEPAVPARVLFEPKAGADAASAAEPIAMQQ